MPNVLELNRPSKMQLTCGYPLNSDLVLLVVIPQAILGVLNLDVRRISGWDSMSDIRSCKI